MLGFQQGKLAFNNVLALFNILNKNDDEHQLHDPTIPLVNIPYGGAATKPVAPERAHGQYYAVH